MSLPNYEPSFLVTIDLDTPKLYSTRDIYVSDVFYEGRIPEADALAIEHALINLRYGITKQWDGDGVAYAFLRFTTPQVNATTGEEYDIHADLKGLVMGGSSAERNFANVIKNILSDSEWGKGFTVDSSSFSTAATATADYYCDGFLAEQVEDLGEELNRMLRLIDGEWAITADIEAEAYDSAAYTYVAGTIPSDPEE